MTKLPPGFSEAEAIKQVVSWLDLVAEMMTTKAASENLETYLLEQLYSERTISKIAVMNEAAAGCVEAERALRQYYIEYFERVPGLETTTKTYMHRLLSTAPIGAADGRNLEWKLHVGITLLMQLARQHFPFLKKTSSEFTVNQKRKPSHAGLVRAALIERGFPDLSEDYIGRIARRYGKSGEFGQIDVGLLAQKLTSSFPRLSESTAAG